eukprot:CAMPEP_0179247334 /NCGR_PEP_ID=MMETSP0797-20121207/19555_1 /TAXON_ID=47934 /ORGANISM="Dinophysis acuminata, Strain DAEP01" /LENGTH=95 /DNA_ID=CAMNT_0020954949 /DNA_START=80 /DNA_END=365 /DNA_ORIENTATION=-
MPVTDPSLPRGAPGTLRALAEEIPGRVHQALGLPQRLHCRGRRGARDVGELQEPGEHGQPALPARAAGDVLRDLAGHVEVGPGPGSRHHRRLGLR